MKAGKVPSNILNRSVINLIGRGPAIGTDAAVIPNGATGILSATAVGENTLLQVEFAVYRAANNIWAAGGDVLCFQAAIICGRKTKEATLKDITRSICRAADNCGGYLSGGHTTVNPSQEGFIVTITAIGTSVCDTCVRNAVPGDSIVVSKWIGLEGTAGLAESAEFDEVRQYFAASYLEPINEFRKWMMIKDEAKIAVSLGVHGMHDVSEGGLMGALYDMSECMQHGITVDLQAIPFKQETIEVATRLKLNAYRIPSMGSLIMLCEDGAKLVDALADCGIPAVVIGKVTDNNDKIVYNSEEQGYLNRTGNP